ncbi:hypothetical protein N3553_25620, partial [Pantoea dispersa]|uniref:ATP-binding protein n=1 Tax=Pantoea dispersa TaxID=59814 RepID=UPI0036F43B7B|nr:hypothetical protein [Pantoea dispersa]
RAESSRNRASGGSWLGLAICNNIVEAHDGSINAADSDLCGLKITLNLPYVPHYTPFMSTENIDPLILVVED